MHQMFSVHTTLEKFENATITGERNACAAMGVSFISDARSSNAFRESVLFRVHEGVSIISDFLLKVGGDSASCSVGEIIPFQELRDVWPISSK